MVANAPQQPFPAGFNAKPAPFGVGFVGAQCSEPKLIEIAYAFEQATKNVMLRHFRNNKDDELKNKEQRTKNKEQRK